MRKYFKAIYYSCFSSAMRDAIRDLRYPQRSLSSVVTGPFLKKSVVFIHIPKVAGTSISEALYGYDIGHHTLLEVIGLEAKLSNAFKFSFVRDPLLRLFSTFNYLVDQEAKYPGSKYSWISTFSDFESFVLNGLDLNLVLNDRFFFTQSEFLDCPGVTLDFVGKFENLTDDYQSLMDLLGSDVPLPHKRKGLQPAKLGDISPSAKLKVFNLYEDDYVNYGYNLT